MRALLTRLTHCLWIPLLAFAVGVAISFTPLYQRLDSLSLDAQTHLVAEEHFFEDVLVIDIDDQSLRLLQPLFSSWPYSREVYALLIDYLSEMGAQAVVFDILLADPRPGDAQLQQALVRNKNVALAASARNQIEAGEKLPATLNDLSWPVPAGLRAQAWPGLMLPLPRFAHTEAGRTNIGVVSVTVDNDGILRRLPLFHRFGEHYLPTLPLAAHFNSQSRPPVQFKGNTIQVGSFSWPVDRTGAVHLNYPRNKHSVLSMPFSRVATAMLGQPGQQLEPDLFRGKTIFVGGTAYFSDRVLTPVGEMDGLYVLAIAHQALAKNLVLTPSNWRWSGALLLIALLPSLLLPLRPQRSALAGTYLSLAAAGLVYGGHLALLYWLKQESALLLPLSVLLLANLLETMRALRLLHNEQAAKIHVLANDDPLTKLPNRFSLQARLAYAIEGARKNNDKLAVILIGLNDFKTINNTLGHDTGDQMLIETASRLRDCVRANDIVARLGGDEFAIVVSRVEAMFVTQYAETILAALAQPYRLTEQVLHVTSSAGISFYPTDGADVAALLKNAEAAMYRAKEQGRNNFCLFTSDLSRAAMDRLLLENQLRLALSRHELVVFYQPQIDLQNKQMVAVEALVRWNHPIHGLLGPDHFIHIAEDTGLILPLGEWVLRNACQQLRAWHQAGLTHIERVAVNLSARQFEQPDLPRIVASVLKETGLDANHLELEITESVAMQNPERSIEMLNILRRMGITLALDDFGTGHSSLTYLKLFPFSSLKIDGSFVRDIETDQSVAEICSATIALAHKLGLSVVAEGIEKPGQYLFLSNLRCGGGQGYLISHPLPATDVAQLPALLYQS